MATFTTCAPPKNNEAYYSRIGQHKAFYRLPTESETYPHSSGTFLIVFAISLFVRGFMAKALMPAALTVLRRSYYHGT